MSLLFNLLFSILLTLIMNGLDMVFHLSTGWTVHLNYVAIKLTIIFLTTFLIAYFIGKGKQEGIVTSIFGPFLFYIYYLFANPTLNRQIFTLDEQFWFFFVHMFFMLIAYFSALHFIKNKKLVQKVSFIVMSSFSSIALYAVFIMSRWRLQGLDEETAASSMTFNMVAFPLLSFILISSFTILFLKRKLMYSLIAGLCTALLIFAFSRDIVLSFSSFLILNISYYMIYKSKLEKVNLNLKEKTKWLIIAIITGLIGAFYEFVPRKIIKSITDLLIFDIVVFSHRIRQNDLILFATIMLIISLVSFYKFYKLNKLK